MVVVFYICMGSLVVSLIFIFGFYNKSATKRSEVYSRFYSEPGTKSYEQRRIEANCNDIWKGIKTVQKIANIGTAEELLSVMVERQSSPYELKMGRKKRPLDEDDRVLIINNQYYIYEANPQKGDRYYRVHIGELNKELDVIEKIDLRILEKDDIKKIEQLLHVIHGDLKKYKNEVEEHKKNP